MISIKDIYGGKPDANDEIREKGYEEFANSYITPSGIDIDNLASTIYGTKYFIMGDKGTGKTALLHYLERYVHTIYPAACTSFIGFQDDFSDIKKGEMEAISSAISTTITIDRNISSSNKNIENDFTYVWRWQLYQKIIDDNDNFKGKLFVNNDIWNEFKKEIFKVTKTINRGKMHIPGKFSISVLANPQTGTVMPTICLEPVDFTESNFHSAKNYSLFVSIIERADELVPQLIRTDIPYYIFIDELEAYCGDDNIFYRDLRMIRDLLFTVKWFNDVFRNGTKFICSVRLEILNSINRFIQPKQMHKIMQGFDEKLLWEYANTNSFNHPIISILIKRIEMAERNGNSYVSQDDIIKNWFSQKVYGSDICTYILDNTWHRPRDIVRLLLSAQSKECKNSSIFNQNTFDTCMPEYSKQCLVEVKEEMRALYTANEIECIINCLQGYKMVFSFKEMSDRASAIFPNTVMANQLTTVLNDIYRIGLIGNYLPADRSTRWGYKAQYKLFLDSPWELIVHPALRIEMSVSNRKDRYVERKSMHLDRHFKIENGSVYKSRVMKIYNRYILVKFEEKEYTFEGYISMKNMGNNKIEEGHLNELFSIGESVTAEVIGYNPAYENWYMRIVSPN